MSPLDAAALALIGMSDRRLLASILRIHTERATADDVETVPARESGEAIVHWAARCRLRSTHEAAISDEVARLAAAAHTQLRHASAGGIVPVALDAAEYPPLLRAIPDPPPILWVRGDVAALQLPAVAVVGSRAATPHGLEMARRLSADLAAAGWTIVSGLARGIDSAAHAAVLAVNGRTIAVLGCGVDRVYPSEHRDLARHMSQTGAVVSEFPPGVPPLPHHFPLRNRIVSGLSRAVVVVEAAEKSGALITASAAAEQGRDVMAVPGPVIGGRNRGSHLLIRDGARIVESAEDVLQELTGYAGRGPQGSAAGPDNLPQAVDFTVDDVAARTGRPTQMVLAELLELELAGKIQRIGAGRFVRSADRVLT